MRDHRGGRPFRFDLDAGSNVRVPWFHPLPPGSLPVQNGIRQRAAYEPAHKADVLSARPS